MLLDKTGLVALDLGHGMHEIKVMPNMRVNTERFENWQPPELEIDLNTGTVSVYPVRHDWLERWLCETQPSMYINGKRAGLYTPDKA